MGAQTCALNSVLALKVKGQSHKDVTFVRLIEPTKIHYHRIAS